MTNKEKIYQYKDIIYKLYSIEGRSKSYISRLLDVDRRNLIEIINNEWCFEQAHKKHLSPSNEKYYKAHKQEIKKGLKNNLTLNEIANSYNLNVDKIKMCINYDKELKELEELSKRNRRQDYINSMKEKSYLEYNPKDLEGEIWKTLPNASKYKISNMGRLKSYKKKYDSWVLLKNNINKNGRVYINYVDDNKKRCGGILARIVAFNFCEGYSKDDRNTVNHIDGDILNNKASNLEWVSQSDNNKHSYRELNRPFNLTNQYTTNRKKIIYKNKYEFKTVRAFAKFLGKSETQTRRYMKEPLKYDIKIIYKDNCND